MNRVMLAALALVVISVLGLGRSSDAAVAEEGTIKLFNGKDFTGWVRFVDPASKADPDKIWTIEDGMIRCQGSVNGYIRTEKEYGNYLLRLQWRWGEKVTSDRNSGVFVHVSGPDKIWPRGVEAQLFINHAGDFWLVDGFKLMVDPARRDPHSDRHYFRMKDHVEKPIGEWNQYDILCKDGIIKLTINGQLVNEGRHAEATRGKILMQSEGAEIFFRNIELRQVD